MGQLLGAHRQRHVDRARANGEDGHGEGGRRRCAGVLDVDDRGSEEARRPERRLAADHLLGVEHAGGGIGEEHDAHVGRGDVGVGQCLADRF